MNKARNELTQMLQTLVDSIPTGMGICSLDKPRSQCVSFLRSQAYSHALETLLSRGIVDLCVLVPRGMALPDLPGIFFYPCENVDLLFTLYANSIYEKEEVLLRDLISSSAMIDPTASIGSEGLRVVDYNGERLFFRHHGNVVIGDDVFVGANAVVQRGSIDSTVVGNRTVISSLCVVGHNTVIGEDCTIAIQAGISGSSYIGNRCWIGIGAKIRNNTSLCDDVFVGMGSIVTESITKPGVYVGNPCRFLREHLEK